MDRAPERCFCGAGQSEPHVLCCYWGWRPGRTSTCWSSGAADGLPGTDGEFMVFADKLNRKALMDWDSHSSGTRIASGGADSDGTRQVSSPPMCKILATGCQDLHLRAATQQRLRQRGAALQRVLAVVQEQQQSPATEVRHECRGQRLAGLLAFAQCGGNTRGASWGSVIGANSTLRTFRISFQYVGGGLQPESRLADAARAGERQQPCSSPQPRQLAQLPLAPDETAELDGQVVAHGIERGQRGKSVGKAGFASCQTRSGAPRSFRRCWPRSHRLTFGGRLSRSSAVTPGSSTCPLCAIVRNLAQRLTAVPQ